MTDARARILERRATLVAASLALSGCATRPSDPPMVWPTTTTRGIPNAEEDDGVPKGASPELSAKWHKLFGDLATMKRVLDRVEKGLASCATLTSAPCIEAREAAAGDLYELSHTIRLMVYVCKPKDPDEIALAQRTNAEVKLVQARAQKLGEKWRALVGEHEWNEATDRARGSKSVPCLSFSCKEYL